MEAQRTRIQRTTHKKPYDYEKINRTLLICYMWILAILARQTTVPSLDTFAPIYHGSIVLVSVGFLSSFLGLVNSKGKDGFSRFCALYSSICLALVLVLRFSVAFFPSSDLPSSFKRYFFFVALFLSDPLPLFVFLSVLLPLFLNFFLPIF